MPWLETLTLSLGASVAKHILRSWLSDGLPNTLLGDLVDFLKDEGNKASESSQSRKQIDNIGEQVAKRLFAFFKSESVKLEDNERTAIAIELARTLSKCEITSKLLVECNLDAHILGTRLINTNSDATKYFSEAETAVYTHLLTETSKSIIEIATDLASFETQFSASILESQDQIYNSITKLLAIPSENSKKYEKEYRRIISESLNRVEMFGVPQYDQTARKQSLTIAYIPLDVNMSGQKNIQGEKIIFPLLPHEGKEKKDLNNEEKSQNASVELLLAQARRIVIRGFAGSGKTTLMKWIAVRSALYDFPSHLASWNNTVPFYIPLREFVGIGFPDLEEFPRSVARMLGGKPEDWVHEQLDSGRGIILIDGVDELPSAKRPQMLEHLNQLVTTYPFARYIVTSRPHALKEDTWSEWQDWIKVHGFAETTLQPMNLAYTEHFIDHWHLALNSALLDEKEREEVKGNPDGLKRLLKRRPPLRRLANNPLLCAMICALYRERRQSLPSERLKIYQECVEMLIS